MERDDKCIALTGSGTRCKNPALHADPATPGGPLIVCGVHFKRVAVHAKALADRLLLQRLPLVVNAGGNDNNAPAPVPAPTPAPADKGKEEDDEMTEEEHRADRRGSLPGESKGATISTVDKGASKARVVDVVKIDNTFYVCNVTGSSVDDAGWKTFWEKHVGNEQPANCCIKDCQRKVKATGHMYWRDDRDGKIYNYLIPICSHHNSSAYDWTGDDATTNWQQCKRGFAVKIKEHQIVKTHSYNLRERKKK